ncbi:MAG: pseudouridine synthase [Bdellovibrionota bacterium]
MSPFTNENALELPILFIDDHIVVVNKPSGLLVHRSAVDKLATEFALQIVRDQTGRHVYPVHRLDRGTSGALVFAFSSDAARELNSQFAEGLVHKKYMAIVRGYAPEELNIDYPLKEILDKATDSKARTDKPAQEAITAIRSLSTVELPFSNGQFATSRYSLVEAIPKTGRKHQIRRHLSHLKHPIVGDTTYGKGLHNRLFETHFGVKRLLLACTEIGFSHPALKTPVFIRANLACEYKELLQKLDWGSSIAEIELGN